VSLAPDDPWYVDAPRYENDIRLLRAAYPDEVAPDKAIARALGINEEAVQVTYTRAVSKLAELMRVNVEED